MKTFLLGLLSLSAFAQDDLKVDDVLAKLEARMDPVDALTAQIAYRLQTDGSDPGARLAGTVEYVKGKSFRRSYGVWTPSEGMLLSEDFYGPDIAAFRCLFSGVREGSMFVAAKTDPNQPTEFDRGFLEFVAILLGTDWMLSDVALYPRRLKLLSADLKAGKRKDGDKEYVTLTARRSIELGSGMSQKVTLTWLFDATSYRMEKLEMDFMGQKVQAVCEKFVAVKGVEIPQLVSYDAGWLGRGGKSMIELRGIKTEAAGQRPAWVNDPALPLATKDTADAIREKLKKDPENAALAMSLSNSLVGDLSMMDRGNLKDVAKEIAQALEKVAARSDSAVVATALYCWYLSQGETEAAEKLAEKSTVPDVHCLRANMLLAEKKYKEALEAAEKLGRGSEYEHFVAATRFLCRVAQAKDAKDIVALIDEECKGKDPSEKMDLLGSIEPPVAQFQRRQGLLTEAVAAEFAASDKPELQLLAARSFVRQSKNKDAAELYAKIAADRAYRSLLGAELQAFCTAAKGDAARVLEMMFDELNDVELLLTVAESYFDKKDEEKCKQAIQRTIAVLAEEQKAEGRRGFRWHNAEKVKPLLKKLVEADKAADAKELLVAFVDKNNASQFLYGDDDLLKKVLGDDKEAAYGFAKAATVSSYNLKQIGLTSAEAFGFARKRLDSNKHDEDDVNVFVQFVVDSELRKEAKLEEILTYLELGAKAYPKRHEFRERLGDAYYFNTQYGKAVAAYTDALKGQKERPESEDPFGIRMREARIMRMHMHEEESFETSLPVIVKLVLAHLQGKNRDAAVAAVEKYLKDFDTEEGMNAAAEAYAKLEMTDRVLALKKKLFLKQARAKPNVLGSSGVETGMELARLYLKEKKHEEAYAVGQMTLELAKKNQRDQDGLKQVEELRDEIAKVYNEEDMLTEFCQGKFGPLTADTERTAKDLIGQLDSDDPAAREEASRKLRGLGPNVTPLLREALKDKDPEPAKRLRQILLEFAAKAIRDRFEKP